MQQAKQKIITSATSYFMGQYTKHYLNVKDEAHEGLPPPPEDKKYLLLYRATVLTNPPPCARSTQASPDFIQV